MRYFKTNADLVEMTNRWCIEQKNIHSAKSIFLPAGGTPIPIFQFWEKNGFPCLEDMSLRQLDDVHSGPQKGMFKRFFQEHLARYSERVLSPEQSRGEPADLAILGLGENGHVAFHEPGLPESFFYGVIELSDKTIQNLNLNPGDKGITYGVSAFLQAKAILLIISGEKKAEAFKEFLESKEASPANWLKAHTNLTVLVNESLKTIRPIEGHTCGANDSSSFF